MQPKDTFDFLVIGSGFGGSVSAHRLVEKGYRVAVLERGKRFAPGEFARSNWDLKRYLWLPVAGFLGIQKLTLFRNVLVLSGSGVGGGSLVYANTLMMPSDAFFQSPEWKSLGNWKQELAPHYQTARRMLGAIKNPHLGFVDETLKEIARDLGVESTFTPTDIAVHFGSPGRMSPDPYFGGKGPDRVGCTLCGACMVGCNVGAKNTLDKNYLYFAEQGGAQVFSESEVCRVEPASGPSGEKGDGKYGWWVETRGVGLFKNAKRRKLFAQNLVFAGGVLGTVDLLMKAKHQHKTLPGISEALGQNVRTNSEVFTGVTEFGAKRDYSKGVAIGSMLKTDGNTSVEPVRYPAGSNFMRLLAGPLVQDPLPWRRTLKFIGFLFTKPLTVLRWVTNARWAQTSQIFLVMQNLDNRINMKLRRSPFTLFRRGLTTEIAPGSEPVPSEIRGGNDVAFAFAKKVGGVAQCAVTQVTINIPTTAHVLGGCPIGKDIHSGVIDAQHRVFGYEGLWVCDGSAIPANLGVNPSLTICALTERAMSFVPSKEKT
jgi:cholesterol oxidase